MRKSFWQTKIPTILGLIIIGIGTYFSQQLVKTGSIIVGRASSNYSPKEIRISNVSDTTFVVSYKTEELTTGSINVGKDKNLGRLISDDRDQIGSLANHHLHYFTIKNLEPNSKYYFSIISGSETFQNPDTPFEIITKSTKVTSSKKKIYGKVVNQENTNLNEFIVYVIKNSQIFSQFGKIGGSYEIDISALNVDESSNFQLLVISDSQISSAKISVIHDTIPTITMGKSYDFTSTNKESTIDVVSSDSASLGFPALLSQPTSKNLQLLTPKKDEAFSDQKPLFKGTAPPGTSISITINSNKEIVSQVKTNVNGDWTFRPSAKLEPGEHTITISMQDATGILRTITQSFVVYAEGSSFTEPSVSPPEPTTQPTITPLVNPTSSPTAVPTPSPTLAPTIIPTIIPTITPILIVRNNNLTPGNSSFISISITSLFLMIGGSTIFFLISGGKSR